MKISTENINLILNSVGLDRVKLNNELEKVKTLFKNKRINTKELQVLLNINTNDDFNLLKDQALLGNKLKTNKLLGETNFEGEKIVFYLSSINQRLKKLSEIYRTSPTNLEKGVSELKPPIFWKDKPNFVLQAQKWSLSKVKKYNKKHLTWK